MSSSLSGNGPGSLSLRTFSPGSTLTVREKGAAVGPNSTLRGPVLRSYSCDMLPRQLLAACAHSASLNWTCTSFSASANVVGVGTGPVPGPVPNAGGAPAGCCSDGSCRRSQGVSCAISTSAVGATLKPITPAADG